LFDIRLRRLVQFVKRYDLVVDNRDYPINDLRESDSRGQKQKGYMSEPDYERCKAAEAG
jgi:hypothetical protein